MEQNEMQLQFFQHLKSNIPPHLSFVDEIAELLEISNDSAYRRIRGEKMLSFEEIKKLCGKYRISVDQLLNLNTDTTIFAGKFGSSPQFTYEEHLKGFLSNVQFLHSFEKKELFYFTKDLPGFIYFMFPGISAFKNFAWMKTLLNLGTGVNAKFTQDNLSSEMVGIGLKIAELYTEIPTTEIMNVENIMTTLRQLEYYKDSGLIANEEHLKILYRQMHEMIDHMEAQAELGKKFLPGKKPTAKSAELKMFVNDFVVGDNSILATLNDSKVCFINHNIVHFLMTNDKRFCEYSYGFIQNIIKKSMLISVVGERERTRFFNLIRERIEAYRTNQYKTLSKI
ncbi:MAG: hypothetical protein C5B52_09070 [Bacteroidetes bacterium]|nr:MAG: hypothetical protein C5B52_09070 [Bacteroidota bacterium]